MDVVNPHTNNGRRIDRLSGWLTLASRMRLLAGVVENSLLFSFPSWVTNPFLGCCTISRLTTSLRAIMISMTVLSQPPGPSCTGWRVPLPGKGLLSTARTWRAVGHQTSAPARSKRLVQWLCCRCCVEAEPHVVGGATKPRAGRISGPTFWQPWYEVACRC